MWCSQLSADGGFSAFYQVAHLHGDRTAIAAYLIGRQLKAFTSNKKKKQCAKWFRDVVLRPKEASRCTGSGVAAHGGKGRGERAGALAKGGAVS